MLCLTQEPKVSLFAPHTHDGAPIKTASAGTHGQEEQEEQEVQERQEGQAQPAPTPASL